MGEMRVRFLLNKASKRILYMEAGKDLVDMLFAFLQLPVATILHLFAEKGGTLKVGCISSVYESLQKLSDATFVVAKGRILNPPCALKFSKTNPQLLLPAAPEAPALPSTVYRCSSCHTLGYVSWVSGERCPHCQRNSVMNQPVSLTGALPSPAPQHNTTPQGYVQHYLSFIVTDDLSILPASTIESIVLLNKRKVEKMSDLDSFESSITAKEALELLRVSFTSNEALNQVFGAKLPTSASLGSPTGGRSKKGTA